MNESCSFGREFSVLNKNQEIENAKEEKEVLDSIKSSKIVIPMVLGIGVLLYLVWSSFEIEEFRKINWGGKVLIYTLLAIGFYILRHLILAYRLRILSNNFFSWSKSIELTFIWEFASAVSPTSLGGSAVSLFLLAQEKLSTARTVTLVLYAVVMDTIFFVVSIPILFFTLGPISIRPDSFTISDLGVWWFTIALIYLFVVFYGIVFVAGIFKPAIIQKLIRFFGRMPFLNRWQESINKTADDMVVASKELRAHTLGWHLKVFVSTFIIWVIRFLIVNFVITALTGLSLTDWYDQYLIYARSEMMHSITQFSPTPGGSGVTELLFGDFYSDVISKGISSIVALIWRLITYYPYLIIGLIIVPNWIRKIWVRRRRDAHKKRMSNR